MPRTRVHGRHQCWRSLSYVFFGFNSLEQIQLAILDLLSNRGLVHQQCIGNLHHDGIEFLACLADAPYAHALLCMLSHSW